MATKTLSQSQRIRDYKKAHPTATAPEIAKALKVKNPQTVYNALAYGKGKKKKKTKGHVIGNGKRSMGNDTGHGVLIHAVEFVRVTGGLEAARAALATLEKVQLN
jgi:hypothetical protein